MLIPKKNNQSESKNHDRWLLTYSDMITLLLGLFIILYSISQVDQVKYREVAKSIRSELSTDPLNPFYDTPAKSDIEDIFSQNNRIKRVFESFQYKYKNSFSGNVDLSYDKSNHLKIMIFHA
jgi:chemotaxis protein MotB